MILEVNRKQSGKEQTISEFFVKDPESGKSRLFGYMLELPDKGNQRNISRIPAGEYPVNKRWSPKYSWHFHVRKVPKRSYILIHKGNYKTDTRGCLLPGTHIRDINKDGLFDVVNSTYIMKELYKVLPHKFKIIIKDERDI